MKITIDNLTITNDHLNNDNFVSLIINDPDETEVDVSLDDLYAAVKSFIELRKQNRKRDKLYK